MKVGNQFFQTPGQLTVSQENQGQRLDQWLLTALEGSASRMEIQRWIKSGSVRGDGAVVPARRVKEGEQYWIDPPPVVDSETIVPVQMDFEILYEDEELAVIHKPPGIAVHQGPGDGGKTLVSGLVHRFRELSSGDWKGRPGIVHRLDKPTEGILLVAKNLKAHRVLSEQFLNRSVKKQYLAWLLACPPAQSGEINAAIKRHPKDRLRMRVDATGRPSITRYRVVQTHVSRRGRKFALVELDLLTGRTHQIRVHMSSIQCPVVGDDIYSRSSQEFKKFGLLLFAQTIEFQHPVSGDTMHFELQPPERFARFEASLEG
ncbi:MAG: RluA family pseudouridine synthase [Spirochaetia bacterium]|nr:RluA family pseudouridine synthase [Spirochaetia bacterium]